VGVITRDTARTVRESAPNGALTTPRLAERILSVGFALAVIAVVVQTAAHLTNALLLDYGIANMDATIDGNALSWASSVATFAAALGALLLGMIPRSPAWRLLVLAAVLAFFSLDDVVAIHEKLAFGTSGALGLADIVGRAFWPVLYFPLFLYALVSLWQLSLQARERVRHTIWAALALFALAFAGEAFATLWWSADNATRFLGDDLEVALEEGAELGGWIILAAALGAILVSRLALSPEGPSRRIS
jgi:hypothetical protein